MRHPVHCCVHVAGFVFLAIVLAASPVGAQDQESAAASVVSGADFAAVADRALDAMASRAAELGITGVAVVAFAEGEPVTGWSSKMRVVGKMTEPASGDRRGSNLLAIAYTKASEMADTLRDSGSGIRPVMTGETGWQGGLIRKGRAGYLLAAFSGGPSADDIEVSRAGLDAIAAAPAAGGQGD